MAKAQVGDLIRVVESWSSFYSTGDILEVVSVEDSENVEVGSGYLVHDKEYVIHRKAGEEDDAGLARAITEVLTTPNGQPLDVPDDFGVPIGDLLQDAVNPQHYKQGRVEVIDIIEDAVQGADPFEAVCQANIIKYSLRYRHKNGVEDLRKSVWYTEKLIAYLDAKSQLTPAGAQSTE